MKVTASSSSTYLGVFTTESLDRTADAYASNAGSAPGIVHTHFDWVTPASNGTGSPVMATFTDHDEALGGSVTNMAQLLASRDSMLAVSWDPLAIDFSDPGFYDGTKSPEITMQDILSGSLDAYIREVAREVASMNAPIMMSLYGEVNAAAELGYGADGASFRETVADQTGQYGDPTLLDGPERMRDVFRHVIDIFNAEGATNATWFMYMSTEYMNQPGSVPPDQFYPGDSYIDWVGQSLYVPSAAGVDASLQAGYDAWAAVTSNPFFIPELGRTAAGAATIDGILTELSAYSNIGAATFVDFDVATTAYGVPRLGADPAEWTAIQNAAGYGGAVEIDGATFVAPPPPVLDVIGTAGADYLVGGSGPELLRGGAGDDIYVVETAADRAIEPLNGGDDIVIANVDHTLGANVETLVLEGSAVTGAGNTAANAILGNGLANTLSGNAGDDLLMGEEGDDRLDGNTGDDVIDGGAGNDTLNGGYGDDVMDGGAGNDRILVGNGGDYAIGGTGADVFFFYQSGAVSLIQDFELGVDTLDLTAFNLPDFAAVQAAMVDLPGAIALSFGPQGEHVLAMEGITSAQLTADQVLL